jgi:hypothetical protein
VAEQARGIRAFNILHEHAGLSLPVDQIVYLDNVVMVEQAKQSGLVSLASDHVGRVEDMGVHHLEGYTLDEAAAALDLCKVHRAKATSAQQLKKADFADRSQ